MPGLAEVIFIGGSTMLNLNGTGESAVVPLKDILLSRIDKLNQDNAGLLHVIGMTLHYMENESSYSSKKRFEIMDSLRFALNPPNTVMSGLTSSEIPSNPADATKGGK